MRRLVLAVLLACLAVAPAALACEAEGDPTPAERYALARDCARDGRPAGALAHYEILLAHDPGHADWLLGKGQALLALGRPAEALAVLQRARSLAPEYEDVWRVQLAAHERLDDYAGAEALLVEAERAFPDAAWHGGRRAALAERRLRREGLRVHLWAAWEDLSGGRPAWRSLDAGLDRRLDERRRVLGGLHAEERFGRSDGQFYGTYVHQLDEHWTLAVSGDAAPSAEVLPEWSLALETTRSLPGGRSLGLRARRASFETVDVDSLAATVEQYAGVWRAAYTLTGARPTDIDWSFGHVLRLARDYGRGSSVTLAAGFGDEAETVAPGVVRVTRVKSAGLSGVHWTSAAWGWSWEAGWHEQGDLYRRLRLRLGVEHRF